MVKIKKIGVFMICVVIIFVISIYFLMHKPNREYTGPFKKITLAAYEGDSSLITYIAEEQGYFQEQGLGVEFKNYVTGKLAADALIAGEADLSTSSGAVLVSNSFNHPDLRILGTIAIDNTVGLFARKDKGIRTEKDLIGKKVGVTKKSTGEYDFGVFLTYNELSIEDVEIIDMNPDEIVRSVVSGEIDAGFTWEPNLYNAKNQLENNALIIKKNVSGFYFILLSKNRWLENNADAAERFMRALIMAESYIEQNPEGAKQFAKDRFSYEEDYLVSTWADHKFVIELTQSLLLTLEDQARWRIKNKLTDASVIPNYLDYIYTDALDAVKPENIRMIK